MNRDFHAKELPRMIDLFCQVLFQSPPDSGSWVMISRESGQDFASLLVSKFPVLLLAVLGAV